MNNTRSWRLFPELRRAIDRSRHEGMNQVVVRADQLQAALDDLDETDAVVSSVVQQGEQQ